MMKRAILIGGVMLLVAAVVATGERTVSAQGASTADGIFTAAQAERGMAPAMDTCGPCHGESLMGGDFAPGITGADFIGRWEGETLDVLVTKVTQTMPLDRPAALSPRSIATSWPTCSRRAGTPLGTLNSTSAPPGTRT